MKLSVVMILSAIVSAVFGLAFILVPAQTVQLYGVTADAPVTYVGRLLGASLVGYAFLSWFARDAKESEARRAIVSALFVGESVGFLMALIGQLAGVVNILGWSTVAVYLLFAVGFGYYHFTGTAGSPA